jgi:hypothetical protein
MHFATRMILILLLVLAASGVLSAQESEASTTTSDTAGQQAATETTSTDTAATDTTGTAAGEETPRGQTNYETRNQFTSLLSRDSDELITLLVLEPALLSNEEFLAGQPELARFVKEHPEVGLQPSFYLAEYGHRARRHNGPDIVEPLVTLFGFVLLTFALGWIVRTIIEQKRWNRLTRTQTEVHNKILDRFGTTSELLEYVKSPAGTKFLESAPIPLRAEPAPTQNVPATRVIWSVQLGVITGALGVGLLLVSLRYAESDDLFALGAIAVCIGLGFIGSAAVTLLLSRRLGLWQSPEASAEPGPGGFVR